MSRRHVERLEVVPVGFDLGTFGDAKAETDEHVFEQLPRLCDQVQVPAPVPAHALGEIEALGFELGLAGGLRQRGAAGVEDRLDVS